MIGGLCRGLWFWGRCRGVGRSVWLDVLEVGERSWKLAGSCVFCH